ncbi:MAG: DUF1385 domain-containing protein [Eubacteriales bacterium]|nr:DUF1385 domain-containing protein [Eubacteriales bacterium]
MKKCTVGGQAVMEGVMMKAPTGMAMAVRRTDGSIAVEYHKNTKIRKKGSFATLPFVRGIVAFVESLVTGMKLTTRSAELLGEEFEEEPNKFEKWLAKVLGKSAMDIAMVIAVVLAVALSLGLFVFLPQLIVGFFGITSEFFRRLLEGAFRLLIFFGYIFAISKIKDIKRVFQYHGAEHKTIACYEAELELTPENAKKCSRFHPRCGTNYMFLVMAISIIVMAILSPILNNWIDMSNRIIRLLTSIVAIPLIAGISYEVLKGAAAHDNIFCRIVRAPGLALQRLTTKEPDESMLEVAITSFNLAMNPPDHDIVAEPPKKPEPVETKAEEESTEPTQQDKDGATQES